QVFEMGVRHGVGGASAEMDLRHASPARPQVQTFRQQAEFQRQGFHVVADERAGSPDLRVATAEQAAAGTERNVKIQRERSGIVAAGGVQQFVGDPVGRLREKVGGRVGG